MSRSFTYVSVASSPDGPGIPKMIVYFIACILFYAAEGLRSEHRVNHGDEFVPDYSEFYYYHNLNQKMGEALSINNCTTSGDLTGFEPKDGNDADFKIVIVPPSKATMKRWNVMSRSTNNVTKLYVRTTPNLCEDADFIELQKGRNLNFKGCLKMYKKDKKGARRKVINRNPATLHPEHIRCNTKEALSQCVRASDGLLELPDKYRNFHSFPFLISTKKGIVSRSGFLALPCGPLGLFSSCESVKYGIPSSTALLSSVAGCRNTNINNRIDGMIGSDTCPFRTYNRVFVLTQYDDTQIGQFVQEALPKLIYQYDFIKANPDIKIHFGFTKRSSLPDFVIPHLIFNWLGLSDRLINGTIYANEIYVPREGGCQDVGYNAWELVTTRDKFYEISGINQDDYTKKRSIIVIKRSASLYTANQKDYKQRRWPDKILKLMLESINKSFPNHRIDLYDDKNKELMLCRECQIKMFHDCDIVIAIHGAGLTNTMFMKPGTVVIEVIPKFDSRFSPILGIFPRLSGIIGLHHYTYYCGGNINDLEPLNLISDTVTFATEVGIKI